MSSTRPETTHSVKAPSSTTLPHGDHTITLIGLGAIGISFLALHLTYSSATVCVYDPRPDLHEHIEATLPLYLPTGMSSDEFEIASLMARKRLVVCQDLETACRYATIVQEQGPENLGFKQATWEKVVRLVGPSTHLWSSTSGIPASRQLEHLPIPTATETSSSTATTHPPPQTSTASASDAELYASAKRRLLIVHPFNPPHIMPLLELVPSPSTDPSELSFARSYFAALQSGHRPITIHKESAGFVANRLSFILFREACHLVNEGVVSVDEVDEVVRASLGPRWAVGGPFQMYGFGGGARGMEGFLANIGEAIDGVWRDAGAVEMDQSGWREKVVQQTNRAYGLPSPDDVQRRDQALKAVIQVQQQRQQQQQR